MPWDRRTSTDPKYRTKQHRDLRAKYARQIRAGQLVECTAKRCEFRTRTITNPNGRDRNGLHLGHNDDGVTYSGPQHAACNVKDGARRARAKQGKPRRWEL